MYLLFRGELVTAVWTAVRVLEPFFNTLVSENVFTFRKANRLFYNTVWVLDTEFVIADHASF